MKIMKQLCLCAVLAGAIACGGSTSTPTPEPVPAEKLPEPQPIEAQEDRTAAAQAAREEKRALTRTFAHQLESLDRRIAKSLELAEKNPRSWLGTDRAATLYLERARLTGDYADYAKAEELVEKSFGIQSNGFGPFMTRARLNFTLHRLDLVVEDLRKDARQPGKNEAARAAELTFAGNLAFQRGQYSEAQQAYEAAAKVKPNAAQTGFAVYKWKTGDFEEAEKLFLAALPDEERAEVTEPIAWIHLMLGLMDLDRGRYDEALEHYRTAESFIRGYWLIDEHVAEILTLQGKTDEAIALYEDIVERTNNPEFMDALAEIWAERGDEARAQQYVAQARKRYEEQLAQFPEAAYGHALEHYLEFGEDPKQTLAMAEKNHALRPNAEAKALLARAYLAAGEKKQAKKTIEAALQTPYSTADFHLTAAEIFQAVGDEKRSAEQVAKAQAINPRAKLEPAEPEPAPEGG
jgi:Tfp pilus assembly protein PilF